jgi:hypothetical protein
VCKEEPRPTCPSCRDASPARPTIGHRPSFLFCCIGAYTSSNSVFSVWLMVGWGTLGFFSTSSACSRPPWCWASSRGQCSRRISAGPCSCPAAIRWSSSSARSARRCWRFPPSCSSFSSSRPFDGSARKRFRISPQERPMSSGIVRASQPACFPGWARISSQSPQTRRRVVRLFLLTDES